MAHSSGKRRLFMSDLQLQTAVSSKKQSVWTDRNFLTLFFASTLISFGMRVYELALPLIMYQISDHSSVAMSTMRAVEFLPNLLLAMIIGVIIDRVNKKKFMQMSIGVQVVILFGLYLLMQTGHAYLAVFLVGGFVLMTFNYSYYNARTSITKIVLPTELLTSSNAVFSFVMTLFVILGPALSGFILMFSKLQNGLLITGCCLFAGFLIAQTLKMKEEVIPKNKNTIWSDLLDGFRELRANRPLVLLTMLVIVTNSTDGMFSTMIVFFGKDSLHLDNSQLGLLLSSAGLGGLVGSLLVSKLRKAFQLGHLLAVTILMSGLSYLLVYLGHNSLTVAVALFIEGLFMTIFSVCVWSFRQETTPAHLMGRISGITGSLFKLGMPFAIFASGWVSELFNTTDVFLISAVGNLLLLVLYLRMPLFKMKGL
jgi:predicted MFS family arabinose efflux permease